MQNQLCEALLHTTNNDNTARANAENYMKNASKSQGCLGSLLQIATNQQVSKSSSNQLFFDLREEKPANFDYPNYQVQSGNHQHTK